MGLFTFYLSAMLASAFASGVLSLFGSIVVARERITNVLFYSQTAKLGIILGLFINNSLHRESAFIPFSLSLLVMAIFYIISEYIGAKSLANKEAIFLALFVVALQSEDFLLYLLKSIEQHELNKFYGDIVTIEGEHIFWLSAFSSVLLIIFIFFEKKWFIESFNQMIFKLKNNNFDNFIIYHISVMFFITLCVLFMGLWLTLASLLIAPIFLCKMPFKNRWVYYATIFCITFGGCFLGFTSSLILEDSPTTPIIICSIAVLTFCVRTLTKIVSTIPSTNNLDGKSV